MSRVATIAAAALLALPAALVAQAPSPPQGAGSVSNAVLAAWMRASTNMPAAAELMPPEKFAFKPSPEQMSFGEIIAHEAQANETLCGAAAGGAQAPNESAAGATAPKDQLVARLRKSFDTCRGVVEKISDAQLSDSVPFFGGRKATKARVAVALAQDWADHYAQAAMYLRANGILPPSARKK